MASPPDAAGLLTISDVAGGAESGTIYANLEAQDRELRRLRSVSAQSVGADGGVEQISILEVSIPTLEMRSVTAQSARKAKKKKESLYVVYIIELRRGDVRWRIGRRFSEFYTLNKLLRKVLGKQTMASMPRLPPKRVRVGSSKLDPKFTLMRRERLSHTSRRLQRKLPLRLWLAC